MNGIDFSQLPLRDIRLPDPVAWWPPAPGWWLLLIAALLALGYAGWRHYRLRRHRAALKAISRIAAELDAGGEPVACLQDLSAVLRRFVMTVAAPADARTVPGLVGPSWLDYLDERFEGGMFRHGAGRMLLDAPYAPERSIGREQALELTRLCSEWIRAQRPPRPVVRFPRRAEA